MSGALGGRGPVAGFVVLGSVRSLSARESRRAGLPLGFVPGRCASLRLRRPDLPRRAPSMVVALAESVDESAPAPHSSEHDEVCPHCAKSIHRIVLRQGLPSKELLETILFHGRAGDAHRRAQAFYLVDFDNREEYKLYGPGTTTLFAHERLGLSLKEAQTLLRVGRKLEILVELDEAFARGEIGWSKVREICRVATPETERAWLLYAKSHNMREIEHAVARKKEGDSPPKEGEPGGLQTFLNVMYRLTPTAKLAWETALAKVFSEFPKGATIHEVLTYIAETMLHTPRDPERDGKRAPIYTIVFQTGPDGKGWAEFNEGRMEIPLRDILEIAGKARVIEVPPLAEGEGKTILLGQRGTVPKEERDTPATPAMRFAVSVRENNRCAICKRRRVLQDHHCDSLALGGKTLIERLLGICIPCHGLLHNGLIRLGVLPGGKLEIRDREGNLLAEFDLAEMLPPEKLVLIEREIGKLASCEKAPLSDPLPPAEPCAAPAEAAAPPAEPSPPVPAAPSELSRIDSARMLRDLPRSIGPEGFRALSGRIEWSAGRKAFLFHPEREALRPVSETTGHEESPRDSAPAHRPETLSDVIGQDRVVSNLRRAARVALERAKPFPHTLLLGPPGMGKTSLAEAVARQMKAPIHRVFGTLLQESSQVLPLLAGMARGHVLFIDEIHGLSRAATECLHGALEDGHVDLPLVAGAEARVIRLELEPFTLLGATTEAGKLPAPFRARFQEETLAGYTLDALVEISARTAGVLGIPASVDAAREAARRSRKTPRLARKLIERAAEFAHLRGSGGIEAADVLAAAESLGIDAFGLGADDRRILDLLARRSGPVGIDTIAATLRMDRCTVRDVHERWLLEEGLVVRTPRGRALTAKGREVLATIGDTS